MKGPFESDSSPHKPANKDQSSKNGSLNVDLKDIQKPITGVENIQGAYNTVKWFHTLVNSVLDGVIVIDSQGQVIFVNEAAEHIFGYRAHEMVGSNVSKLMPEPYQSQHNQYLQNYLQTGIKRIIGIGREVTGLRKDGSVFSLDLTLTEFVSGNEQSFIGVVRDISVHKQMSEKLRISENMKNAVIQSCLDAVITIDQSGCICEFNPSAEQMFGYSAKSMFGQLMFEFLIPERFRSVYQQGFDHYLNTGEHKILMQRIELSALNNAGQEFPIELTITPLIHDRGVYFTAFIRDISETKKAQVLLRQSLKEAELLSFLKSQFLATMSHEIRTPLNAILGAQELLADTQLNELQHTYLQMAQDAGNNLFALVKDMIDLTKVEAGKLVLENQTFELLRVLDEVFELINIKAQEKGLVFCKDIAPEVQAIICGDSWRLRQVLVHLLGNAVKFTHSGEVRIKVSVNPGNKEQGELLFEVIDTGIGIDDSVQQRLFEPFIQADLSDTRKFGGSGLGLAIVKGLVKLWDGILGLESQLGQGCRFWFTFGQTVEDSQGLTEIKQHVLPLSSSVRAKILLVEDSPSNQAVLSAILRNANHEVEIVDHGAAAISAVQARRYDVIFMDVSMPEMDGIEATLRIRALGGAAAEVPIIAMTAHALRGYQERCLAVGMNDYATKPISKQQLLELVERWCASDSNQNCQSIDQSAQKHELESQWLDSRVLSDLSLDAGIEDISPLIDIFINELILRQALIKDAIENQSLEVLANEVHVLKSTAGTFGAKPLRALAIDCNEQCRQGDLEKALAAARRLLPCLEETMKALQARIN